MVDANTIPARIPATLNVAIMAAQVAACAGIFVALSRVDSAWQVGLLALAFAIVGNSIYAIMHEAMHGVLLPNAKANAVCGSLMALLFPASFHLLRQAHLLHHMRNRSDDEAFEYWFDGESPVWKWMQLYCILTGVYWLIIVVSNFVVLVFPFILRKRFFKFDRPTAGLMESFNPRYWRVIRIEALLAIALHTGVVLGLGVPLLRYCLVYAAFGFVWSAMQYTHHFDTRRDVIEGSRNVWVFPLVDTLWLNHDWHRVHHRHPTLPWNYLAKLGRVEDGQRSFALWHYLRMWRGPRRAVEHVENHYAGRLIR
ncbi:MAG: fatty acid desaturase [Planctomycetes bacterium]|nr:fatty acid desaturase [Planctomycetota bacterium]